MLSWALLFGVGVFLAGFAIVFGATVEAGQAKWRGKLHALRGARFSDLPGSLRRWVGHAEKRMRVSAVRRRGPLYVVVVAAFSLVGFWFGIFYLRNLAATVLLALAGALLPNQVWYYQERLRREKILEQLGVAVRVFVAEYSDTPHMTRALGVAAQKLPDPIGGILRKAERDLLASKDRDEVLVELGQKLDSEYGRMFVQLLRLSVEDEAVKPLFSRLAVRLSAQQNLIRRNRVEVAVDRLTALLLNAAVVPVYLIMRKAIPESGEFFTATAMGKTVVALCIGSAVTGMILDRLIGGGESD